MSTVMRERNGNGGSGGHWERTADQHFATIPQFSERAARGKVYLVGAGPGDPRLITLKGLDCLRAADVVIYDRLISPLLLEEASSHATRVFAGKEAGWHSMKQEQINALLIAYALQGHIVVRLKGGDPFLFGR